VDEAGAQLTAIKGIGPWTAEVFLLFCAGHRDIFPAGDVALQHAVDKGFDLQARPQEKQLRKLAEFWSPHRGIAARLFWAYYAHLRQMEDAMPV
jgi:DNA-3-methyladenine glycosylase II